MALYRNTYRTETTRLRGFDYGSEAIYFITICTKNMIHHFGTISDGKIQLSKAGKIVADEWLKTGEMRKDRLTLGEWVVMPNHFHCLIHLKPRPSTDASHASQIPQQSHASHISQQSHAPQIPQQSHAPPASHASAEKTNTVSTAEAERGGCNLPIREEKVPISYKNTFGPQSDNIPSIIRGFKGACTRRIRTEADPDFGWLRGYYDHIVRNQGALLRIEKYIRENPSNWQNDKFKS